ncbi:DMT family transporter [Tropicibacter sp. R15_0]|uniref:DMT family transporter n=1 Tax=Tropicibacter sp. R15_0 TaxID=2821101 RepID=UPI001ADAC860|nr:DMT family transporter [Tropicibacter sp. R15_0]MBO9467959.1 DMT family transporter [Tropicibacter sp. R15_0]
MTATLTLAPQNLRTGILLAVATAFAIASQDVVFKLFNGTLSLWQIFALRGLIAVPMIVLVGLWRGQPRVVIAEALSLWPIVRGLCLTTTFLLFYAALPFLSLSTAGAGIYTAPIFVALLSAFVIGEQVGRLGWIGVVLGFVGVVVLLQPGSDVFSPLAVLPVIGAGFYAMGHIVTRTKCQGVSPEALALALNTVMCVAAFTISGATLIWPMPEELAASYPYIFGGWSETNLRDWAFLAFLAVFAVIVGMMLARAYQIAPPATVATFEYSYLLFVAGWDIAVFGLVPSPLSVVGMAMIIGAGMLVMRGRG